MKTYLLLAEIDTGPMGLIRPLISVHPEEPEAMAAFQTKAQEFQTLANTELGVRGPVGLMPLTPSGLQASTILKVLGIKGVNFQVLTVDHSPIARPDARIILP